MITREKGKVRISINIWKLLIYILLIISIVIIFKWVVENNKNQELKTSIENRYNKEKVVDINGRPIETIKTDFESLSKVNNHIKAWIKINNTNINYPIVQFDNNEYYLTHNIKNEKNSAGWIFIDYRNNMEALDKNTIIYGHNRLNNTMFAELENILEPSWYTEESNKYITFNTISQDYIGEIITAYKIKASEIIIKNTFDEKEYEVYLKNIRDKSIYDFKTEININDKIITLYTCDDNNDYRIIVQAKLIKI